jgi:DNA primase
MLIFRVSKLPETETMAAHRIYLKRDGSGKADVPAPKKALGAKQGNAIWFGTPGASLQVAEGPESALSVRACGYPFVACTIDAGNMGDIDVPDCVKEVVIIPDNDNAGRLGAARLLIKLSGNGLKVRTVQLPAGVNDPNDLINKSDVSK